MRKFATHSISELLPGLSTASFGKTYAACPVWTDSTTKAARFAPMPKKQAARIWHKARRFDRQTRQPGKHGGAIGRTALNVLYALLFEFLNYRTGQLDPSYEGIARRAGVCRRAVATALQRLRSLGVLNWLRRCTKEHDHLGRLVLIQETNAYAVMSSSQWRGYFEIAEPTIHPTTWGAVPPLPSVIEQAVVAHGDGDSMRTMVTKLKNDPVDKLAAALASLGSALGVA